MKIHEYFRFSNFMRFIIMKTSQKAVFLIFNWAHLYLRLKSNFFHHFNRRLLTLKFFHRFFHRLIEVCLLQRYFLRQNIRNHIVAGYLQSKEMAQNEDDSLHQYSKFAQQFCACFSSHNKIVSCQWTKESDAKMGLIFLLMATFLQPEHIIVISRSVRW